MESDDDDGGGDAPVKTQGGSPKEEKTYVEGYAVKSEGCEGKKRRGKEEKKKRSINW